MTARSYLRKLSDAIVHAQRPVKVLKALNWDPQVHARFFRRGASRLPDPEYQPLEFDPDDKIREFRAIRARAKGRNPVEDVLRRRCDEFIELVRMLKARGTKRFFHHSVRVFGEPRQLLRDSGSENLDVARLWTAGPLRPRTPEPRTLTSSEALGIVEDIVRPVLGDACRLKLSRRITADAAAGSTSIALRRDARFSPRQARALAHHEGLWHVLTSFNGHAQPVLTVLGVGLPGFTTAQEGAGVLAEHLSGNATAERFRELGERALIVDLAAQGADYLQVFRYLCERFPEDRAAQMAERVFRGGVLTGGAPFTKDAVYQRGYCRAFNFVRHAIENGQPELITAFFAGKMSLEDAPLVAALIDEGLVAPPVRVPAWAEDLERLGADVLHSLTMSRFDIGKVSAYYDRLSARNGSADAWEWGFAEADGALAPAPLPFGTDLAGGSRGSSEVGDHLPRLRRGRGG